MSSTRKGLKYVENILSYTRELLLKEDVSSLNFKDILGFEPPKGANVFLPHVKCVPITALLPLYDTLTVGIPKIEKVSHINDETGLTFNDIVTLAHKNKLILYINVDCVDCLRGMSDVIQQFVDNDVPMFFGGNQSTLLSLKVAEPLGIDFNRGIELARDFSLLVEGERDKEIRKKLYALAKQEHKTPGKLPYEIIRGTPSLVTCAIIDPTAEYVKQVVEIGKQGKTPEYLMALAHRLYMIPRFLLAKAFNSTLSTNITCRHLYGIEKDLQESLPNSESPDYLDPYELEFIEKKLKIAYSENTPLAEYIEIFDSKTTNVIRQIIRRVMLNASSKGKSLVALQNSLNDYNREVNEIVSRRTKRAKIVYATSDILRSNAGALKMLIEGIGEKYLNAPQKAWDCVVIPKRHRHGISKWLSEKAVKLESKLAGVSPDIIHLYHTRTCVEKLKQTSRVQP